MGNAKSGASTIKFASEDGFSMDDANFFYLRSRKDPRFGDLEEVEYAPKGYILLKKKRIITDASLITNENLFWLQQRVQLKSPNLLSVHGFTFCNDEKNNAMLTVLFEPFASDGEQEFLNRRESYAHFKDYELMGSLEGCFSALEMLESNGISHGFITPSALLMGLDGELKLADHELLDRKNSLYYHIEKGFQLPYIAPEGLHRIKHRTNALVEDSAICKADVFSLGMVFLQMAMLESPSDCYDWKKLEIDDYQLGFRLERLKGLYPPIIHGIVASMLEINPQKRPTFSMLKTRLLDAQNSNKIPVPPVQRPLQTQGSTRQGAGKIRARRVVSAQKYTQEISLQPDLIHTDSKPRKRSPEMERSVQSSVHTKPEGHSILTDFVFSETREAGASQELLTEYCHVHEDSLDAADQSENSNQYRFVDPLVRSVLNEFKAGRSSVTTQRTVQKGNMTRNYPFEDYQSTASKFGDTGLTNSPYSVKRSLESTPLRTTSKKYASPFGTRSYSKSRGGVLRESNCLEENKTSVTDRSCRDSIRNRVEEIVSEVKQQGRWMIKGDENDPYTKNVELRGNFSKDFLKQSNPQAFGDKDLVTRRRSREEMIKELNQEFDCNIKTARWGGSHQPEEVGEREVSPGSTIKRNMGVLQSGGLEPGVLHTVAELVRKQKHDHGEVTFSKNPAPRYYEEFTLETL